LVLLGPDNLRADLSYVFSFSPTFQKVARRRTGIGDVQGNEVGLHRGFDPLLPHGVDMNLLQQIHAGGKLAIQWDLADGSHNRGSHSRREIAKSPFCRRLIHPRTH
jgi:hypothetical protein